MQSNAPLSVRSPDSFKSGGRALRRVFLAHRLLRPETVRERAYQVAIATECEKRNTLVILPTGMGKTVVALLTIVRRLEDHPGQVLFVAPTKPLVEQHAAFLRTTTVVEPIHVMTGERPPEEREFEWRTASVVCATPQVVQNDVVAGRVDLSRVTLLIVDEAHRASGDYPYVFIAEQFRRRSVHGRVLALTASPGADPRRVRDVCAALDIEGIEVRTPFDKDTAPYLQDVGFERVEVAVPEATRTAAAFLRAILQDATTSLREAGVIGRRTPVPKRELLAAQARLQTRLREEGKAAPRALYDALSDQALALKLTHALELAETQGVQAFESYCERLEKDESRAARRLLADPRFAEARLALARSKSEHPKMRKVLFLLREQLARKADSKAIVFTNYRDIAETLSRALEEADPNLRPLRFVGQQSRGEDRGLSQKEQVRLLDAFRAGTYNVLVATSVAEEGLDIPATDLVVFYEPVASEIRSIQRRGRTGRNAPGRVVVLVSKGTSDEGMLWASMGREKRMRREIEALRAQFAVAGAFSFNASEHRSRSAPPLAPAQPAAELEFSPNTAGSAAPASQGAAPVPRKSTEPRLDSFAERSPAPVVVCDHRELASAVARELVRLEVTVRPETLTVADYVVSDRVAIERKTTEDFENSLRDGRLFTQLKALRDAYLVPVLLVEGGLAAAHLSVESIYGAVASVVADLRISIFFTKDAAETARILSALARREQVQERRPVSIRHGKGTMTDDDRLRFLVEGLPDISAVLARRLLAEFGTVQAIANATEEELRRVEGIGRQRAQSIAAILRRRFGDAGDEGTPATDEPLPHAAEPASPEGAL